MPTRLKTHTNIKVYTFGEIDTLITYLLLLDRRRFIKLVTRPARVSNLCYSEPVPRAPSSLLNFILTSNAYISTLSLSTQGDFDERQGVAPSSAHARKDSSRTQRDDVSNLRHAVCPSPSFGGMKCRALFLLIRIRNFRQVIKSCRLCD